MATTADLSIMDVVAAAEFGAQAARDALLRRAVAIGRAVALLFDVINPEVPVMTEPGVRHLPECLMLVGHAAAKCSRC
jgi:predicted NBD/HSP70 family sugar kinase